MIKKLITLLMACFFLGGSVLLPMGDFSLMRDIPGMYHSYAKITTSEELGIIDFIGDYLLHGKEMFGHNKDDKPQSATNNVQFQHHANPLNVLLSPGYSYLLPFSVSRKTNSIDNKSMPLSDYHHELFRPPLA